MSKVTRNSEALKDFVAYCEANPSQRFWQALVNWSGFWKISASPFPEDTKYGRIPTALYFDTYNWEGKNEQLAK